MVMFMIIAYGVMMCFFAWIGICIWLEDKAMQDEYNFWLEQSTVRRRTRNSLSDASQRAGNTREYGTAHRGDSIN